MRNKKLFRKTKAANNEFRILEDDELDFVNGGTNSLESEETSDATQNVQSDSSDSNSEEKKLADLASQAVAASETPIENVFAETQVETSVESDYVEIHSDNTSAEETIEIPSGSSNVEPTGDTGTDGIYVESSIDVMHIETSFESESTETQEDASFDDMTDDNLAEITTDASVETMNDSTLDETVDESSADNASAVEIVEISGGNVNIDETVEISGDNPTGESVTDNSTGESVTDNSTDSIFIEGSIDNTRIDTSQDDAVDDNVDENKVNNVPEITVETQNGSTDTVTVFKDTSDRMRDQIISLDQENYNIQNGSAMMKVAEDRVSSTIEILKTLKEKVINATADTNTEVDRQAIQKEIDQSIAQIDDNALTTFNGKILSDGSHNMQMLNGGARVPVIYTEEFNGTILNSDENNAEVIGNTSYVDQTDVITVKFDGESQSLVVGPLNETVGNDITSVSKSATIDTQIEFIQSSMDSNMNETQNNAANSAMNSYIERIAERNMANENTVAFNIGNKANPTMILSLEDMRANALGLSGEGCTISVADKTSATAALKVIDNALQRALNQQASIGATMNRLEFTSNNLTTASENLQSAESTYRDADMAKEMTELTKNNILMQASTAMLSQANQQNQSVLQMLQ